MDTKPEISVIIPTYNRPEELKRAVRSVLRQSVENFELIVANDGNDCGLGQYFEELADERIVYTKNLRTKGGNGARNTGIDLAQADYIAFLDDDDEWHEDKIKVHLESFKQAGGKGCSVCSFWHVQKEFDINSIKNFKIKPYCFKKDINLKNILLGNVSIGGSSTLLFEKSFFCKIGMMDEKLQRHQDLELMLRATEAGIVHVCKDKLVYIHGHNDPEFAKAERLKEQYFLLINVYLEKLSRREYKKFYANEYKKLAISAVRSGNKSKMLFYLTESLKRDLIPSKKYLKVIYYILKSL